MKLPLYQIDAFADKPFSGNPAAVVPLEEWLPDQCLQSIAEQNNLSETAFYVSENGQYHIRWFTPGVEVDLCGHATLATAHHIFSGVEPTASELVFASRSGDLRVIRDKKSYTLDFPQEKATECSVSSELAAILGVDILACFFNVDYLVVLESESAVASINPDFSALAKLNARGVIITAVGDANDFVCRFFAPAVGINEDPVTGSAFTKLVPYWASVTGKRDFKARQISDRGGDVACSLRGERVLISGNARTYLRGTIEI